MQKDKNIQINFHFYTVPSVILYIILNTQPK